MRNFLFGDNTYNNLTQNNLNDNNTTGLLNDIINSDNTEILLFLIIFLLLFTSFGRK